MSELKNKLKDVEIPEDSPFDSDRFHRKEYAESLRSLALNCAENGCVFAINGGWGVGKTTFVKMWAQYMRIHKHQVVYFNAWESDFAADPLIPMLAELNSLTLIDASFVDVIAPLLSLVGETALLKFTGLSRESVKSAFETDKLLQEYLKQREIIEEFQSKLSDYVTDKDDSVLPLIFIVDELDRCNPSYAVKVLERIKHILDVPNIFFVLAINKEQLEHSVKGFYGSDFIDATNYLRRFIDIEFEMPSINSQTASEYLYDYYEYDKYFYQNHQNDDSGMGATFKKMMYMIIRSRHLDLRTMGRICSYTRLVLMTLSSGYKQIADVILLLCYLKFDQRDLYVRIKDRQFTLKELFNKLEIMFLGETLTPDVDTRLDSLHLLSTLSRLLYLYNSVTNYAVAEQWLNDISKDTTLPITTIHFNDDEIKQHLAFQRRILTSGFTLGGTISRLEFAEAFRLNM